MQMLEVTDLKVRYGAMEAVKGVSFVLGRGETLGIVGESGSGKSTVVNLIPRLYDVLAGSVTVALDDLDAGQLRVAASVRRPSVAGHFLDNAVIALKRFDVAGFIHEKIAVFKCFRYPPIAA